MKSINIDRSSSDAFYRYKMPSNIVKIEGRGNGIKTVLVNIEDIAKSLNRDPKILTKYLSYEMGTLSSIDDKNAKYIINGAHDKERVQEYLFNFIDELVLCKECRNPETVLFCSPSRKSVLQKCSACGGEGVVRSTNKIMKTLLKELSDRADMPGEGVEDGEFDDFEDFDEANHAFG
ncbi:translation initiation factor 5 [Nematocida homosporus]|uniref:translation initiation factor 5 n=1 Tax=Nematocida homosporus TaxID=1912981 RepID=UPI002221210E|nr:translation initiation factor 5 [Nematocida homosporus]KAI5184804.1 translation initiation factor 5 [Nematocida homosporus]